MPWSAPSSRFRGSRGAGLSSRGGDSGRRASLGGVGFVLASAFSVHSGSAVAATLFPAVGVGPVVAMRLVIGAILLLVLCRPRVRGLSRGDWAVIGAFGFALAAMNSVFYEAIQRIPLGPAVTIEVLGPLTLSVIAARKRSAWLWAGLALAGVALLGQGGFGRLDPVGVGLILIAAVLWASYIVLSSRAGARFPKADGLALAMAVAALLSLPMGVAGAGQAVWSPSVIALGSAVAVLSSALPYSLELFALRRLPTATFAVLMSLGPAIAACAGWAILNQSLTWTEALATTLVIAASIGAVRSGTAGPTIPALAPVEPAAPTIPDLAQVELAAPPSAAFSVTNAGSDRANPALRNGGSTEASGTAHLADAVGSDAVEVVTVPAGAAESSQR